MRRLALYLVRWLVRHRVALFIATLAIAVWCAFLIPQIHINSDLTRYLPDSYAMKRGMAILDTEFPSITEHAQDFDTIFSQETETLPQGLGKTLIIGVALVFTVLLIMSSSFLEVVLFLITIGVAVLINVGSNAMLGSVSLTTNTISPVLQMVLSMDYCIILMNRYRDERAKGKLRVAAMNLAVGGTAATILSSAFTTIVSLLMLCFIKLRIGTDLGVVLAKGVAISLICNFTLLPALIIWCGKGIEASRKKVPVLPAAPLARFQHRFRIPITLVFVGAAVAFTLLQTRTPFFFAPPKWEEHDSTKVERVNPLLLIYTNTDSDSLPALLDRIAEDPRVRDCISYPSLAEKPRNANEMTALFSAYGGDMVPDVTEDLLKLVYYAHSHPERDEQFSLATLQQAADSLRKSGLMPAGRDMDMESMIRRSFAKSLEPMHPKKAPQAVSAPEPAPAAPVQPADSVVSIEQPPQDTAATRPAIQEQQTPEPVPVQPDTPARPTYEEITTPMTASELAAFLDTNPKQVSLLYRMAGKKNGKMSPNEFIRYVRTNILSKKRYASFLPQGTEEQMVIAETLYDEILAAGPTVTAPAPEVVKDTTSLAQADSTVQVTAPPDTTSAVATVEQPTPQPVVASKPVAEPVPYTALDELVDMYLTGGRYSASRIYSTLHRVGVPVSKEEVELLFLYTAALQAEDPDARIAPVTLLNFLADTLLTSPALVSFAPDSTREMVLAARDTLVSGAGALCGKQHSAAAILTTCEVESNATYDFVDQLRKEADDALAHEHYWVGESEMYKEIKDGFPQELLLLTLLTVLSIFIIVALNFRSLVIPIPLIMTVLAGLYANVWACGLGGRSMYYLSYLIVQGILMGATIDYSILLTSCYLNARKSASVLEAVEAAYRGSSHSILTSGIIMALVPFVMSFTMPDMIVASILKSLSMGAFAVLIYIILLLPGVLACIDPLLRRHKKREV